MNTFVKLFKTDEKLPIRKYSDPKVYLSYEYLDLNSKTTLQWFQTKWEEILQRKNGKVHEYSRSGRYQPYGCASIYYSKGDRHECTLEWNINNANKGNGNFKIAPGITLKTFAKEANISPEVLALLLKRVSIFKDTPLYEQATIEYPNIT